MGFLTRIVLRLLVALFGPPPCPGCPLCRPQEEEVLYLRFADGWFVFAAVKRGVMRRWALPMSRRSERWAYTRSMS